ncbi:MAG: metal-dependent hydrolase [Candidatus Kerfeldbacteria bacterium]|nr:metal-dependent hydrolase [Candidatus Kerfeldbacteria bacterium]
MIIAHGPLGYLVAYLVRRRWTFPRSYYWFGVIGGIFPDIDLFYFYFIDASRSHHQLITHSLVPYLVLGLVGLSVQRLRIPVSLFVLGAISHIGADVLTGYVAVFQPLSDRMIGLPAWSYSLASSGLAEILIIVLAFGTVLRKQTWLITSAISLVVIGVAFVWINQHSYKPNGSFYYGDLDQDGILNLDDRDSDGDGLVNMIDSDIDNDGQDNSVEFYLELFSAEGALFDYSFGHFIEVPLRVGLVNDQVIVHRLFANVGLFISQEMTNDYAARPDGYTFDPTDNQFAEQPSNMITWLRHTNHLLPADTQRQEFDLVFFQSGMMAVFTRLGDGTDVLLDVDASHPYVRYEAYTTVVEREGGVIAIGRVLPKPYSKRY